MRGGGEEGYYDLFCCVRVGVVQVGAGWKCNLRQDAREGGRKMERGRLTGTYRLPKAQENDQLDAQQLQERLMRLQIFSQLKVELNQAIHSNRDTSTLEPRHPNMRKRRVERVFAISVCGFRDHRDYREKDTDETVLEDAEVDDLLQGRSLAWHGTLSPACILLISTGATQNLR